MFHFTVQSRALLKTVIFQKHIVQCLIIQQYPKEHQEMCFLLAVSWKTLIKDRIEAQNPYTKLTDHPTHKYLFLKFI